MLKWTEPMSVAECAAMLTSNGLPIDEQRAAETLASMERRGIIASRPVGIELKRQYALRVDNWANVPRFDASADAILGRVK